MTPSDYEPGDYTRSAHSAWTHQQGHGGPLASEASTG